MKDKTVGGIPQTKSFSHDELWAALRDVETLMDRAQAPMFLLGDTAKQVFEDKQPLNLDKIEVGIRKQEFTKQRLEMIQTLLNSSGVPAVFKEKEIIYEFHNVPVSIRVFQKDYEFFKNPDTCMYLVGNYKVPNPFHKYYQARYLVQ